MSVQPGRRLFSSSAAGGRREAMVNDLSDDPTDDDHEDDDAVVVRVDGNRNVRLALPKGAFLAAGIEPSEHDILEPSDIPGHYEAWFGAASGKDIADFARLPRDPHEWPEKVHGVARWLAAAVPFATDRIRRELLGGQKRKPAIYCDDLAMARGEDPEEARRRLKASAAPSIAHPAVEKDVEAATRLLADPDADRVIEVGARFVGLAVPDALTTVGVNWGVTSPKNALLRINCGMQLVFSCERREGELTWRVFVPFEAGEQLATEFGSVTGQDLAAELGAAIDGKLKRPPSTVELRVSDAAIDRMLENEVLLAAARELTEAQTDRRLFNAGWHHPAVYALLLRIVGDG